MDDRLTRRSMARLLTSLTGALLAGAAGRNPPPRPGTIELIVSSN